MNIKDLVSKIKVFLQEEEINLVDVKTKDDIILSFEVLEVGNDLFIVDQEGRVAAPDGEYILEDGTKIVSVEGKISEIVAPEPVEEEPAAPPAPEEVPMAKLSDFEALTEKVSALELLSERLEALEKENVSIKEILSGLAENLSEKELKQDVKMSMKQPEPKKVTDKVSFKPTKDIGLSKVLKNMYK